jgi:hypothetical protein
MALRNWSLLTERHEAQAREFLDFLEAIYGYDFACEAAEKAVDGTIKDGYDLVRVAYVYDAAGIPQPPYIAEHEQYYRRHGRVAPTSGKRLMARRLKTWMKEWED